MNRLLVCIFLLCLSGFVGANDDNGVAGFEKELFTPQVLNHFGIGKDRFQALTDVQKQDLLEAKKTLTSFLKATQNPDADLSRFLGREFLARHKTRGELLTKLLGQETEILLNAVTEFELQQDSVLLLKYYVVLFSEGNLLVREDLVRLKKQGKNWKILSIGGLE